MMNIQMFSLSNATDILGSGSEFPVDFDDAWKWLGYTRKNNAKKALLDAGFIEGIDLLICKQLGTLAVPAPEQKISLTVDCFKTWAMMAGTNQGKVVRKYFLECEKLAKQKQQPPQQKFGIYVARETLAETNPVKVPEGYWIVFHESCKLMLHIELVLKYPVEEFDLCDGSIGIRWANYRLSLGRPRSNKKYQLQFPDKRGIQEVAMYSNDELLEFRSWLENVYKVEFLSKYLAKKYPNHSLLTGAK